jgi:AcrR family transcriptional regulator
MSKKPTAVSKPKPSTPSSEQTRLALIRAGLKLFGERGFAGTSTRELAGMAGANIGSIAYHFGGKEGLRMACAEFIVDTAQRLAKKALQPAQAVPDRDMPAADRLHFALEEIVSFIVANPEASDIVQFVLREVAHPTAALDTIYNGFFEPTHKRLCLLWAEATGEDAGSEAVKITVFTLIGQILYFRIARPAVMRRLGWKEIGAREAARVTSVVQSNLAAILGARKGQRS